MKILREAGLVSAERRASWVFYALEARALGLLRGFRSALGLWVVLFASKHR
jgi:DNA-binding transcriptional ArsR family regulator